MDINEIAGAAASVLVTSMATDAWTYTRSRIGQMFGKHQSSQDQESLEDIDGMQAALVQAPVSERTEVARDLEAELRGLLKNRLRQDPAFAAEFAAFAEEISEQLGDRSGGNTAIQYGKSEDNSTFFQIGRDFHGPRPK